MGYRLKCTSRFPRSFYRNGRQFTTWYERWTILNTDDSFLEFWDVTEDSYVSHFLSNLLGHREFYKVEEDKVKIFETIFQHTNRWKLFQEAWNILNKKGSRQALKFLYNKFSIIALSDKLEGKGRN